MEDNSMDEVLSAFLGECYENLEKLDNELVMLEKQSDPELLSQSLAHIFRTVHTIKGSCGWLGLDKLGSVVHDGEDLLVALREKKIRLNAEIVNHLLQMFDAVREILASISATGKEGDQDYSELIAKMKALQVSPSAEAEQAEPVLPEIQPGGLPAEPLSDTPLPDTPLPQAVAGGDSPEHPGTSAAPEPRIARALVQNNVRVDVGLLDKLMNLASELVLARNQMLQLSLNREDAALSTLSQHLNMITSELQESVMKTRMQPIGTLWNKLPRLVRDLSLDCGKQVQLEIEGQETELDRTLLEAIKDPLTHLVRNAIDHGFGTPAERQAMGKPPVGRLLLQAFHEGGKVNLAICDDGRGMDPARIKTKAIEKGLLTPAQAAGLSERGLLELIFLPGFSTAEKVTSISGRGVGMDVVKSNIEAVGGSVELSSRLGQGTTFRIKLPLTLAILPVLMVSSGGERFAIPQISLVEMVSLTDEQIEQRIERLHNVLVYRLRGTLLPLISLSKELNLEADGQDLPALLATRSKDRKLNIVVLQSEERCFGLVVDAINDTEEIVVKPLSRKLKQITVYAGATILGDGKVALILDVMGLARLAQLALDSHKQSALLNTAEQSDVGRQQRLLMFQLGSQGKMALDLDLVARLEEFEGSRIEVSGHQQVIQYREQILPLIDLCAFFASSPCLTPGKVPVIVCQQGERLVGLMVEAILDIVESEGELSEDIRRTGVLGSLVLQGAVTEILDFEAVVQKQFPGFLAAPPVALARVS